MVENVTSGTANTGRSTVLVSQHVASYAVDTAAELALSAINATAMVSHQGLDLAKDSALRLKSSEQRIKDILKNPHDPLMPRVRELLQEQRVFSQDLITAAMDVVAKRSQIEAEKE